MAPIQYFGLVVVLATALAAQEPEQTGYVIHKMSRGGFGGQEAQTSKLYLSDRAIRETGSNGSDFIVLLDQSRFINFQHPEKTYYEFSFAELAEWIEAKSKELAQREDTRAFESMRKQIDSEGEVRLAHAGPGEERLGFKTEKYQVSQGSIVLNLLVTPEIEMPKPYYDSLRLRASAHPLLDLTGLYEKIKRIDGLVLWSQLLIPVGEMKVAGISEVVSMEKRSLPAAVFEIPGDYTRRRLTNGQ